MKKIIYILIASAAMFSMAVSCAKEEQGIEDTAEQTVDVTTLAVPATISVSIPEEGLTKVSLEQDSDPDGVVKLTWTSSDFITVKNAADESKSVDFTYVSGAGSATATFSADDISALDGATSYNVYLSSNLPADYSNQTQASDGSTAHLGYSAKLAGVNTYDGATFSQTWATANGSGTLTSSSVLRIRAQLPTADIADAVQAVIIKADKDIFNGKDSIRVEITTPEVAGDSKIVTVYATLPPGDVSEATTTKLLFQFQKSANGNDRLTAYRELATLSLNSGSVNAFKINCPNIASYANPSTTNIGQSTNPYLIGDQNQLQWLSTNMTTGTTYFTLVDDINMNGGTFTSFNNADPYDKAVVLDGNDKTVSNLTTSLFADLNGTVSDLTLYNAVVSSSTTVGILANTCNTVASTVTGVTINGTSTLTCTATAARKYVGGLVGEVSTASSFNDCHITGLTVTSPNKDYAYSGAAFGYVHNASLTIGSSSKCTVSSSSVSGYQYVGGFVGYINKGSFKNNEAGCTVTGVSEVGGFTGQLCDGSLDGNSTSGTISSTIFYTGGLIGLMQTGTVKDCHSTSDVTNTRENFAHAGGLIGRIEGDSGTVEGCYAEGDIESTASSVGGLIGSIKGSSIEISKSYATGDVTESNATKSKVGYGGLIGNIASSTSTLTISACHATGSVEAYSNSGGLIGKIESNGSLAINNCYSSGRITAAKYSGGFIGAITENPSNVTVTNGYTNSEIDSSGAKWTVCVFGGSIENVTLSGFVGWNTSNRAAFWYSQTDAPDGNYKGTTGSIYSQATTLGGWDFVNIWTTDAVPQLR